MENREIGDGPVGMTFTYNRHPIAATYAFPADPISYTLNLSQHRIERSIFEGISNEQRHRHFICMARRAFHESLAKSEHWSDSVLAVLSAANLLQVVFSILE